MSRKQVIMHELKECNGGGGTITKTQIAKFFAKLEGKEETRTNRGPVKRLTEGLPAFEGKHYLVTDVAEAYMRMER